MYGRREDISPETAVRSVRSLRSRRDYSQERSPSRQEYRGRDITPVRNRAERPQNQRETKVVNLNGLDSPCKPQKLINSNSLDPPYQPQRVVNPNAMDPPDQLKHKEKLELAMSDEDTGVPHQKIASGGEQSITCTGVRQVQEAVPAYTERSEVGNVSGDAIINTAAEITVISEEVYRCINPKLKLHGKRKTDAATTRKPSQREVSCI
ncbi:hypothetical protein PoB_001482300 [Plakobranchus ocellatus]|uniref:Uncharacterized protein n=1 Tax=Plakobranchus ocellatus TaxID=259542 RepID=A0AAV3Z135_9GAST|nr:hypothetical protein PoB_001482300 [Plakobranchus ocellatus]